MRDPSRLGAEVKDGELVLYRGVGKIGLTTPLEKGETLVWRGERGEGTPGSIKEINQRALASWTWDKGSAVDFARNRDGYLLATTAPVSEIWTVPKNIGGGSDVLRFTDDVGEVVLLNEDPARVVEIVMPVWARGYKD